MCQEIEEKNQTACVARNVRMIPVVWRRQETKQNESKVKNERWVEDRKECEDR